MAICARSLRLLMHAIVVLLSVFLYDTGSGVAARSEEVASKASDSKPVIPPIAFAARVVGNADRTRLIVDFDRQIQHEAYLLDSPKRLVVELPATFFSLDDQVADKSASLITQLRFGQTAPDQSRIIFRLSGPVRVENNLVKHIAQEDRYRLIVDLVRSNEQEFATIVRKGLPEHSDAGSKSGKANPRRFRIVIDPGHGGFDGGATGEAAHAVEKDITLGFSLKLRDILSKNSAFEVIMTRDNDIFVGLENRLELARSSSADLMISVHADSLHQKDIRGATVYTLSEEGSDALSRSLARDQNRAELMSGLKLTIENPNVSDILIDMIRRETEVFSERFAQTMVDNLQNNIKLIRNPHRWADFFVLKAPEVPSILLELGYLSNPEDEALMISDKWQEMVAIHTAEAITAFFSDRLAQKQ